MTRRLPYVAAFAAGLAFVLWLVPPAAIFPPDPLHMAAEGDRAQSIIGQRYFLAEPWGWPPLLASGLNWPVGLNIALTDSIPLLMLPLKLFRAWLPPGFFVQEGWIAIAWTLQPVAAVFALRGMGERRWIPTACVIVLSLSLPTLLGRYGQMSLCTHAVIMAALGLYVRAVARPTPALGMAGLTLLIACVFIHPYLLAMVAAVLAAIPLSLLLRGDRRWLGAAVWLAGALGLTGGLARLMGFGGTAPADGFGFFSMNLVAPFVPQHSTLFGNLAIDATGGQGNEGSQYLGAGLLVLAACLVTTGRRFIGMRGHWGLILVTGAMALFALSGTVYAGHVLVLQMGRVPEFVQQFRATGRFFWPASYLIMLASVVAVARCLRPVPATAVLLAATALQFADTADLRHLDWLAARAEPHWAIDTKRLSPILAAHDLLTIWPSFTCGAVTEGAPDFMQTLLLGSQTLMRTNTMYAARGTGPLDCNPAATLARPWQPHELRLILPPRPAGDRWLVPDSERFCRRVAGFVLCSHDDQALLAEPPIPTPNLPLGETIPMSVAEARDVLGTGWSTVGGDGIWTDGDAAELRFRSSSPMRLTVTLHAVGLGEATGKEQIVRVLANGQAVATWMLPDLVEAEVHAALPDSIDEGVLLRLEIAHPTRPVDRGMNGDTRRLGLQLRAIRLDPA
jgi:hypothetical protein